MILVFFLLSEAGNILLVSSNSFFLTTKLWVPLITMKELDYIFEISPLTNSPWQSFPLKKSLIFISICMPPFFPLGTLSASDRVIRFYYRLLVSSEVCEYNSSRNWWTTSRMTGSVIQSGDCVSDSSFLWSFNCCSFSLLFTYQLSSDCLLIFLIL